MKAMIDIAILAAAMPGQRRLVYRCAALVGVAAGLCGSGCLGARFQDAANYVA